MVERYDRATLLEEVWAEPVQAVAVAVAVAPRYALSALGLKKLKSDAPEKPLSESGL